MLFAMSAQYLAGEIQPAMACVTRGSRYQLSWRHEGRSHEAGNGSWCQGSGESMASEALYSNSRLWLLSQFLSPPHRFNIFPGCALTKLPQPQPLGMKLPGPAGPLALACCAAGTWHLFPALAPTHYSRLGSRISSLDPVLCEKLLLFLASTAPAQSCIIILKILTCHFD